MQHVVIIRHGERLDNVDYNWTARSSRPYDPPITNAGEKDVKTAAERFKDTAISSIISSPFLRCLQTAQLISTSLKVADLHTCNGIVDVLNSHCGIFEQPEVPASDIREYGIKIIEQDDRPLPEYPERTRDAMKRFTAEFNQLADKHWPNNIIIVTHGYGVSQAVAMTHGELYRHGVWVEYCGHVELTRSNKENHDWGLKNFEDVSMSARMSAQMKT